MEHRGDAYLGAEMARIGGDGGERLGGGAEQDRVDDGLVLESDRTCRRRQGEDDVEIRHRQQFGLPLSEPFGPALSPGTSGNGGCGRSCRRSVTCRNRHIARHGRRARPCGTP